MTQPTDSHDLVSMYLAQAVLGAHRIHLKLKGAHSGSHKGQMMLDPNRCQLSAWGDPTGCTKIAIRSVDVETTRMRTLDPQGHGRIFHSVRIEDHAEAKVHLIEYPKANLYYLVEESADNGTLVAPLFPARWFGFDAAGTVGTRYGVPIRHLIEGGDATELRAEAEVVRRALAAVESAPNRSRADDPQVAEVRAALGELEAAIKKLEG